MKIHEFTQSELDYLEAVCNFTDTETELLHLRQKNIPLSECAERMNRGDDSIKKISQAINLKIQREM